MTTEVARLHRYTTMNNITSLSLREAKVPYTEARRVAAALGWTFSDTAGLNEFYTHVRPVWWVFRSSKGERIYLDPEEATRFYAQTARCGARTVETARDGEWELACWDNGDILIRQGPRLDRVVRMADAEIIVHD